MPKTFMPGDQKQDDRTQEHYDDVFNGMVEADRKRNDDEAIQDLEDNYGNSADPSQENTNIAALREQEQEGTPRGSWQDNTTEQPAEAKSKGKITWTGALKKGGPLLGAGGIIGAIIFLLGGFLPAMLIPSLSQNAVIHNDVKGTLLERRLIAAIQQKMADKSGPCVTKSSLCLNNKMPKQMLASMAKAGIVPIGADGNPLPDEAISGKGYVDTNPTKYQYGTEADGKTPKFVDQDGFLKLYKDDAKFRNTFKKAYNMRYLAYSGKNISKFFNKFKLVKDGGASTEKEPTKENIAKKINPVAETIEGDAARTTFRERVKTLFTRAADKTKKTGGDPVLTIGTIACTGIDLPGFIAGTVRSIDVARVLVITWNSVLSPGDAIMSGKADGAAVSALGSALTDRYKQPDGSFGKSASDSSILQAAVGNNKQKVAVSKLVPGYAFYSNDFIKGSRTIATNPAVKESCDQINSPAAAIASAGISGAITAGTAGIGGIAIGALKAIGLVTAAMGGVTLIMDTLTKAGVFDTIGDVALSMAKDAIPNVYNDVKGEDLGDAIGIGMFAMFSMSALSSGAAVLKKSQVASFTAVMNDVDNEYKQEAIATLSPLDTSSSYTFLGSIVSKLAMSTTITSNPVNTAVATLGSILKLPFANFSHTVSADDAEVDAKCGYGTAFDIDDSICINPAGYPAVGIPAEYVDMPRETVSQQVANSVDDTTGEPLDSNSPLIDIGIISGKNNDITSMLNDCSEGDLDSLAGCTIDPSTNPSAQQRAAQSLYVLDQEVESILNGTNEEEASGGSSTASGSYVLPTDQGYGYPNTEQDWGPRDLGFHRGVDIQGFSGGTIGKPVYAVTDGTVTRAGMGNTACASGTSDYSKAGNNVVEITHADGTYSGYWHMSASSVTVKVGDKVTAGQQIGTINECGLVTGPHLHFTISLGAATDPAITSIEQDGEFINPVDYMKLHGIDLMKGAYTDGR